MIRSVLLAGLMTITVVLSSSTIYATSSTLGQTVEPITCIYTITAAGGSTSSSTACDSVAPATLDLVEPRGGKPLLGGTVTPTDLASFRVWVGGVWFTSGVSTSLTVSDGTWTLDLSSLASPLAAGDYTIVLEERTTTDFLLRSIYPNVLIVPVVDIVRTDTSVGKGTVTDLVPSSGDQVYPWLLPEDYPALDWRAGQLGQPLKLDVGTYYTSDTIVQRSSNPAQQLALLSAAVLAGWWVLMRSGLLARWSNK